MTQIESKATATRPPRADIRDQAPESPLVDCMAGAARREIKLYDHGFVALVDAMPRLVPEGQTADFAIVQAARVSYGQGTKKVNEDRGLIRYLLRHRHTTPFEMVEFKFHMSMPIFIARQWIRHRTANVNEYSGRYSIMPDHFYHPTLDSVRKQSATNRQGGSETFDVSTYAGDVADESVAHATGSDPSHVREHAEASSPAPGGGGVDESSSRRRGSGELSSRPGADPNRARQHAASDPQDSGLKAPDSELTTAQGFLNLLDRAESLYPEYERLLEAGVSRELARIALPLSTYTQWYWKCDLHNILHFLKLRLDPHAQEEIRAFAQAMHDLIEPIVPITMEAFRDYELESIRLTRLEVQALRDKLCGGEGELDATNKREQAEWVAKLDKLS
jgi:thymidylate synthase ThyX